jgi:hypothetical protein
MAGLARPAKNILELSCSIQQFCAPRYFGVAIFMRSRGLQSAEVWFASLSKIVFHKINSGAAGRVYEADQ